MAARRTSAALIASVARVASTSTRQQHAHHSLLAAPVRQWTPGRAAARFARPIGARAYSSDVAESKIWSFEEVQKLTKGPREGVILVDVREPGELAQTGRIPGAINIPITTLPDSFHISDEEFEDRLGFPRPSKDAPVVIYCKSGVRAKAAASLAKLGGWKNVGEYTGSWLDWEKNGGSAEKK